MKDKQKMIRKLFLPFVMVLVFGCKEQPKGFVINGSIDGLEGIPVYFLHAATKDTAIVKGGKFSFEGAIENPKLCFLQIGIYKDDLSKVPAGVFEIPIFVERALIDVRIKKDSLPKVIVKGSFSHDEYGNYLDSLEMFFNKLDSLEVNNSYWQADSIRSERKAYTKSFVKKRPDSFVSLEVLNDLRRLSVPIDTIFKMFHALSANVRNSAEGKKLKEWIENIIATSVGRTAPGFTSTTPEGKQLSLDEVKGKVTIIDFWASWCGPCRGVTTPYLIALYKKYHDKGLNIISVSLDDDSVKWKKAIAEDNMTWYHVCQLKGWEKDRVARRYAVSSIPLIFVLDEKGVIVLKTGGNGLEDKVAEIFGE